jgi:hypothetical protein
MSVTSQCCLLPSRGVCDGPITCPEESYRMWWVCVLETSTRSWPGSTRAVELGT